MPPSLPSNREPVRTPMIISGWVCLIVGLLTFWLFGLGFIFLLTAFALGIALLASNRAGHGLALLISSIASILVCGILFLLLIPLVSMKIIAKHQRARISHFMNPTPSPQRTP
jgi:cell division protein FtsW (lipid II flippase)